MNLNLNLSKSQDSGLENQRLPKKLASSLPDLIYSFLFVLKTKSRTLNAKYNQSFTVYVTHVPLYRSFSLVSHRGESC